MHEIWHIRVCCTTLLGYIKRTNMERFVPEPIRAQFDRIFIRVLHVDNLIISQIFIIHHWRRLRNIFKKRPTCGVGGFQNPCNVASCTMMIGLVTLRPDHNSNIMCTGGSFIDNAGLPCSGAERKVDRGLGISQIRPPGSWGASKSR
jgi:hypothetical protein